MTNREFKNIIKYLLKFKASLSVGDIDATYRAIEKEGKYSGYILTNALLKLGYTAQQILNKMTDTIFKYQFFSCYNNEILKIPKNIKFIRSQAFANNYNLKEVYINSNIENIEDIAFASCSSLKDVYIDLTIGETSSRFDFENAFALNDLTIHFNDGDYTIKS